MGHLHIVIHLHGCVLHDRRVLHNGGVLHCIVLHGVWHRCWRSSKGWANSSDCDDCDDGGYADNFHGNLPLRLGGRSRLIRDPKKGNQ